MGWADIDLELVIQDMFGPAYFHRAEEVKRFFKFHINQLLFSFLAGHVNRFVYSL